MLQNDRIIGFMSNDHGHAVMVIKRKSTSIDNGHIFMQMLPKRDVYFNVHHFEQTGDIAYNLADDEQTILAAANRLIRWDDFDIESIN
jgi:hypothetical protein